jgi:hypothetical protein
MPRISNRDKFLLKVVTITDLPGILVQSYKNAATLILKIV